MLGGNPLGFVYILWHVYTFDIDFAQQVAKINVNQYYRPQSREDNTSCSFCSSVCPSADALTFELLDLWSKHTCVFANPTRQRFQTGLHVNPMLKLIIQFKENSQNKSKKRGILTFGRWCSCRKPGQMLGVTMRVLYTFCHSIRHTYRVWSGGMMCVWSVLVNLSLILYLIKVWQGLARGKIWHNLQICSIF